MFHSRQLARAPSKFARRSSLLDLQPACRIACCGFIRLLKSCSAHSALNSFVSNFPTVAQRRVLNNFFFSIKTFKNTVMGRVGGVGGGNRTRVWGRKAVSPKPRMCFFITWYLLTSYIFLSPLSGAEQLFEQAPLHAAALIYERNNKSAKLWWSIRLRRACQQSARRLPEAQHLLAVPPSYPPTPFTTPPHCCSDRQTIRIQIFFNY